MHSNRSSSKGLASSRNSGFRPLKSLQNTEGQGFIRKPEYVGSLVSNASSQPHPLLMSQVLMNVQRKTISPQIIKHSYNPLKINSSSVSNDDLEVRYIDLNDEKENIYGCTNMPPQSTKNAF